MITSYLVNWWGLTIAEDSATGDIAIINEDHTLMAQEKPCQRPVILLSSSRGDPKLMGAVKEFDRAGGFCRIVFKPFGPNRLYAALKLCLHAVQISHVQASQSPQVRDPDHLYEPSLDTGEGPYAITSLSRRYSEEKTSSKTISHIRPPLGPRAATVHPLSSWTDFVEQAHSEPDDSCNGLDSSLANSPSSPTVSVGSGGSLLKSSVGTLEKTSSIRVLVVEDNAILRNLL